MFQCFKLDIVKKQRLVHNGPRHAISGHRHFVHCVMNDCENFPGRSKWIVASSGQ